MGILPQNHFVLNGKRLFLESILQIMIDLVMGKQNNGTP